MSLSLVFHGDISLSEQMTEGEMLPQILTQIFL